jgi:hypothetical protein
MRTSLKAVILLLVLLGLAAPVLLLQGADNPTEKPTAANQPNQATTSSPVVDEACDYACYLDTVGSLTASSGPKAAIEWVNNIPSTKIRVDCHGLYHRVGEVAAAEEWPTYYSGDCEYGFVHGVMRGRAGSEKWDPENFVREGMTYCKSLPSVEDRSQCAHGLGHSAALVSPANLKDAINLCAPLEYESFKARCVDGSMMEYAAEYQNISGWMMDPFGYKEYENTPDPTSAGIDYENLCSDLDESLRTTCFFRLGMFLMSSIENDMNLISKVCSSATSLMEESSCHMGFSDHAIEKVARTEPYLPWPPENAEQANSYAERLVQACSEHPRGDWCIEGAVTVVGHLYTAGSEFIPPICEKVPSSWRQSCAAGLSRAAVLGQVEDHSDGS